MVIVIATLLYSPDYVSGACALAYRTRELIRSDRLPINYRLVLLITNELIDSDLISIIKPLYDDFIELDDIQLCNEEISARNRDNLQILGRPELAYTFYKLQLWKLIQFKRILYVDCDVYPLKSSFFNAISYVSDQGINQLVAAPDCGWPDMFNTGVMVIVPDLNKYEDLQNFMATHVSIDGADQGLLNQVFNKAFHHGTTDNEWIRLPFIFNVPVMNSAYQYQCSQDYFRNHIHAVHFLGPKPWLNTRCGGLYGTQWRHTYQSFARDIAASHAADRSGPECVFSGIMYDSVEEVECRKSDKVLKEDKALHTEEKNILNEVWNDTTSLRLIGGSPKGNKLVINTKYDWPLDVLEKLSCSSTPEEVAEFVSVTPVSQGPAIVAKPTTFKAITGISKSATRPELSSCDLNPTYSNLVQSVDAAQGSDIQISKIDTANNNSSHTFRFPWENYRPPPTRKYFSSYVP